MVVQHNISAMNANRYYGINNKALAGSLEKLSSGYAINRAGDNAAGLAVSEKMRAQIGGLTQASKNAEDGISMVQTFEGALQETDSILQRMRTLAVQSANGSYSDDVDRDAIQLEFDQLNDELNQIADTDFNGTVMLNGGQMADGVHAVNGTIDYSNKKTQVTDATAKALQSRVDSTAAAYATAQAEYKQGKYDLSSNGDAPEWNTVDTQKYDKASADELWAAAGYKKNVNVGTAESPSMKPMADTSAADTIEVTFKYDKANNSWSVDKATAYLNGDVVADKTEALQNASTGLTTENQGNGGFKVKMAGEVSDLVDGDGTAITATEATEAGSFGNAIFDASELTDGSTVTLVYRNGDSTKQAPGNIGANINSVTTTNSGSEDIQKAVTTELNSSLTSDQITQGIADAMKAAEDKQITWKYDGDANFEAGEIKIGDVELSTDESKATEILDAEGNKVYAWAGADGKVTFQTASDSSKGTKLFEVSPGENDAENKVGTLSAKISTDATIYNPAKTVTMGVGDDKNLESSAAATSKRATTKEAYETACKNLDKFNGLDPASKQDWESIKSMYAEAMSSSGNKVSVSDNFDNSTATLTYTNSMDLQVGARSKDMVQFTMNYSSKGLGDLESNLNCSAREGGLETAKLSLRTSEDANAAIDKIDNAINKVNMVRATFGSVQNRLEHKINTLDTNNENLTAAESRIRDTQMDKEMMKFTSSQILSQASQSMLAQANSLPQGVLQLLG